MKNTLQLLASCAFLAAGLLGSGATYASNPLEVVSGSGTWGSGTATTPESFAGETWSFSFELSKAFSGASEFPSPGWSTTDFTNFNYFLNGDKVESTLTSVAFYDVGHNGLFSLNFNYQSAVSVVSLYGADVGSSSILTEGTFKEGTLNSWGIASGHGISTGSGTVTIFPVPEPSEYALMAAGLGLMAFIARRKKSA